MAFVFAGVSFPACAEDQVATPWLPDAGSSDGGSDMQVPAETDGDPGDSSGQEGAVLGCVGDDGPLGPGETCSDLDGWYGLSPLQPCCEGNLRCSCQEQARRVYSCQSGQCVFTVAETRTMTSECEECAQNNPCATSVCQQGECAAAKLPAGTLCGPSHECNSQGQCIEYDPIEKEGWYSAKPVGPVASDVFSWPQNITLQEIQLHLPSSQPNRWRIGFPSVKPTDWVECELAPGNYAVGNWWIIQKIENAFYATTMDYFRKDSFWNDWAPNIFWDHLPPNDPKPAPMTYVSGATYGLMVTTVARAGNLTTNERSNILLFTMP